MGLVHSALSQLLSCSIPLLPEPSIAEASSNDASLMLVVMLCCCSWGQSTLVWWSEWRQSFTCGPKGTPGILSMFSFCQYCGVPWTLINVNKVRVDGPENKRHYTSSPPSWCLPRGLLNCFCTWFHTLWKNWPSSRSQLKSTRPVPNLRSWGSLCSWSTVGSENLYVRLSKKHCPVYVVRWAERKS